MSKLEKFLKESNLSEDAKKVIQEAWDEERADVAATIRLEMKERYTEDFNNLTEGLNKAMSDVITSELSGLYEEKSKLVQDRVKLRESLSKFYTFSQGILAEEVKTMRTESKVLKESLNKFMKFSNVILSEEVAEFQTERRGLVETRVRLLAEGHKQVQAAKKAFVERAAKASAKYIAETTEQNLSVLKADLLEAKQNMLGRKIFEAFGDEFKKFHFNENKTLRGLNETISTKESEVIELRKKLQEAEQKEKSATNKIRIMEDKTQRKEILDRLSKPLTAQQKQIMETLLQSTPTEKLNEEFSKYHKNVLRGTTTAQEQRPAPKVKSTLTEGSVVTGNRVSTESELDSDDLDFLNQLQKNAGI